MRAGTGVIHGGSATGSQPPKSAYGLASAALPEKCMYTKRLCTCIHYKIQKKAMVIIAHHVSNRLLEGPQRGAAGLPSVDPEYAHTRTSR